MNKRKKLVLFDLDGVLIDSKKNMELSWDASCKIHKVNIKFEDFFCNIGRDFKDILVTLNIKEKQDDIEMAFNAESTRLINLISLYDGVKQVIDYLKNNNIRIGIVTSKNTLKTKKILESFGLLFDIVQTPNDNLKSKPAPDHILHAISELKINAKDALYIGDMNVDYESAKAAKVDYAHALWGYGTCQDENVIKLEKISQLTNII